MNEWNPEANEIFAEVAMSADEVERRRLLSEKCGTNDALRRAVESLLVAHAEDPSFLDEALVNPQTAATVNHFAEGEGAQIGPYKLLQRIGEGGFGIVYMAEQKKPVRRKVALKVIKAGMDTQEVIARFEAERQALAMMDHPNIAKVLDAGTTATGRPYFVMELVRGVAITEFCDKNLADTSQRLEMFATVCQAVQHAHHKGIIHRDLKPSNVMVTLNDGEPLVKVIDFGVAKAINQELTEKTLFTSYGQMVGTPQYMSPEQAEMTAIDIDTRSDVYSLGVLLYELLTGTTPLDLKRLRAAGLVEIQRRISDDEAPRPSARLSTLGDALSIVATNRKSNPYSLQKLVRGELDWIVMTALEKDRSRRYQTASDFAADVQSHLAGDTVVACPPTLGYRTSKFLRKHKAPAIVGAIFFALLSSSSILAWSLYASARRARDDERIAKRDAVTAQSEAELQRDLAQKNLTLARVESEKNIVMTEQLRLQLYSQTIAKATVQQRDGDSHGALLTLEQCDRALRGWEWHHLRSSNPIERTLNLPGADIVWLSVSPISEQILVIDRKKQLRLHRLSDGKALWSQDAGIDRPYMVIFSPDGKRFVVAGEVYAQPSQALVGDVATGKQIGRFESPHIGSDAAFDPSGKFLAIPQYVRGGRWQAVLWNIANGKEVWRKPAPGYGRPEFSADGQRLYYNFIGPPPTSDRPSVLACWSRDGEVIWSQDRDGSSFSNILAPDESFLATATDNRVEIRDPMTGDILDTHEGIGFFIPRMGSMGRRLLGERADGSVRVYDWQSKQEEQLIRTSQMFAGGVGFTPDGQHVVSATGSSSRVDIYSVEPLELPLKINGIPECSFSHDAAQLYAIRGHIVQVFDAKTGQEKAQFDDDVHRLKCSPVEDYVVTATRQGVRLRRSDSWKLIHDWKESWDITPFWMWIRFSDDGQRVVAGGSNKRIVVWDVASGQKIGERATSDHIDGVVFLNAEGSRIAATLSNERRVVTWNVATGEYATLAEFDSEYGTRSIDFVRGTSAVIVGSGVNAHVCDLSTRRVTARLAGHRRRITGMQVSPDGRRVFTIDADGILKAWQASSGKEVFSMDTRHRRRATPFSFVTVSPDGNLVATGGGDRTVRIWETSRPSSELVGKRRQVRLATKAVDEKQGAAADVAELLALLRKDTDLDADTLAIALQVAQAREPYLKSRNRN